MLDPNLERLYHALVEAIRRTRGDDFERPVTVSEIYQELVPYRVARASIGFDMNADYEYAVLRLLAGDGDLARVEPAEVRELLRGELESPNPNVSLFRAYANCDVFIASPERGFAEPPTPADTFTNPQPEDTPAPRPAKIFVPAERPDAAPSASSPGRTCERCGGRLPTHKDVHFCPFCGHDMTRKACANCGEMLEAGWRYCANCGTAAPSTATEIN